MTAHRDDPEAKKKPPPEKTHPADPEHAGRKPRLTDEQAHAELRRRQRQREEH